MRRTLAAAGALAALAVAAPAASADTYCVSHPQCVADGNEDLHADLEGALLTAKIHIGPDKVLIGPGTFTGPFAYDGGHGLTTGVTIRGSGPQTVLTLPPDANSRTVLVLKHSLGNRVKVSDLTIKVPANDDNTALALTRGDASNVVLTHASGATNGTGAALHGSSLRDAYVAAPTGGNAVAVRTYGNASAIARSNLRGRLGVYSEATGTPSTVTRTRVEATVGIKVACGKVLVQDVTLSGPQLCTGLFVGAGCAGTSDLEVHHLTAIGGVPGAVGARVEAVSPNHSAKLRLHDSTLTGFTKPLTRFTSLSAAKIFTDYSNYSFVGVEDQNTNGGVGNIAVSNRIDVPPGFVNAAAGDFRLAKGSPLIDAGDPAALDTGFESTVDFAGKPRLVAGTFGGTPRRDIGAHEYQPPPPPTPTPPPGPQPQPQPQPQPPIGQPAVAPKLTLSGAKRQKVRRRRVVVHARADQLVQLRAKGTVKVGRRSFKLRGPALRAAGKGSRVRLVLKLSKRDTGTIRRLLRKRRARATVTVKATTAAGLSATVERRVALIR
jgi:hypothetical protein